VVPAVRIRSHGVTAPRDVRVTATTPTWRYGYRSGTPAAAVMGGACLAATLAATEELAL
jgi:hypothetical protein